jgi:molybdenum cofactor cytidylyltransferase
MHMEDATGAELHVAILAAGASTRFGSPKQLVRIAGSPVLHELISSAAYVAGRSLTVVLGAHAREIAPALRQSAASVIVNRDWQEGLASSIRVAVESAPPRCDGLMLLLADQVAVTADDLRHLYAAWKRHPILLAAALFDGAPGLPAIFPRWALPGLLELRGDRDPKQVIRRNADQLVRIPMPNASVDLDTPEDLLAIEQSAQRDARTPANG